VGQDAAEATLRRAWDGGRFPHAWLLHGPAGIGKATLAFRLARFVLAGGGPDGGLRLPPEHPVARRVAALAHGDLLYLGPEGIDAERASARGDITVDEVRRLAAMFAVTAAEGGWRVALLDGAERMNANAQNALLKLLEEPPRRALLVLTTDRPGRVLPTIRSRCRKLALRPLAEDDVVRALGEVAPQLPAEQVRDLARLAGGSPGRALALAEEGGLALFAELVGMLAKLPALDLVRVHALAERMQRSAGEAVFRLWLDMAELWFQRLCRHLAGRGSVGEAAAGEAAVAERLGQGLGLERLLELWEKFAASASRADALNLDRKQVVLNFFLALQRLAGATA